MGFKLRREVRDLLPPGVLTANERLLVLELADNCRDDSDDNGPAREGWPASTGSPRKKPTSARTRSG